MAQAPESGERQPKAESDDNRTDPTPLAGDPMQRFHEHLPAHRTEGASGLTPTVANILPPGDLALARWYRSRILV